MSPSFVYFKPLNAAPIFKVGRSDRPACRTPAFDWSMLALEFVVLLIVSSREHARVIEDRLHLVFKDWNIPKEEAIAMGVPRDGATEWYKTECMPLMLAYLKSTSDLPPYERLKTLEVWGMAAEVPQRQPEEVRCVRRNKHNDAVKDAGLIKYYMTHGEKSFWFLAKPSLTGTYQTLPKRIYGRSIVVGTLRPPIGFALRLRPGRWNVISHVNSPSSEIYVRTWQEAIEWVAEQYLCTVASPLQRERDRKLIHMSQDRRLALVRRRPESPRLPST